jgi:hypothetical protein
MYFFRCEDNSLFGKVQLPDNLLRNANFGALNIGFMKKDQLIRFIHIVCYSMTLVFITIGFFVARQGQEAFMIYLREDGLVENLQVVFLLASFGIAIYKCFHAPESGRSFYFITWIGLAFLFFFAAGEEISWGQRIFNFGTTGFFDSNNLQHETNLHNLEIGGVKINKLVFSQMMGVFLAFYFLLLRPLAVKVSALNRLVRLFHIPIPRWNHVIALIISIILCSQYHLMKAAELRELAFTVIMFLVFLYPVPVHQVITLFPSRK